MKTKGQMILREIAGEYILIPTGETALKVHGMMTLTESGLIIWKKLQDGCSLSDLVNAILGEYEIDAATALADVKAFLEKLDAFGLLEKSEDEEI